MCCDRKNMGEEKKISRKLFHSLHIAILIVNYILFQNLFTLLLHIKQCSLDPPHFITYVEIVFHFEPNCFFDAIANHPSEHVA